jgi:hypothetical protein
MKSMEKKTLYITLAVVAVVCFYTGYIYEKNKTAQPKM